MSIEPPRTIRIYGAKGGVGTTTVAALFALDLARNGEVVLVADQGGDHGDIHTILGHLDTGRPALLDDHDQTTPVTVRIIDHGTTPPDREPGDSVFMVIRNCYLALRRAATLGNADGVVLVSDADRSLTRQDIVDVVGVPVVANLWVDPVIARAIDAGLLPRYFDRHPTTWRLGEIRR